MLPSCDGCLAMAMNTSIKNLADVLKLMPLTTEGDFSEVRVGAFYLMGETGAERRAPPTLDRLLHHVTVACFSQ